MKKPYLFIYTVLTIYFTAMLMLVSYLIYARFSPAHQQLYGPMIIPQTVPSDSNSVNCQTDDDCVIDLCHDCQAINKNFLTEPNLCYRYCPFTVLCLDQVCTQLPN